MSYSHGSADVWDQGISGVQEDEPNRETEGQKDRMGGPVPQVLTADMGKVEVQAPGSSGVDGVGVTRAEERAVVRPTARSDQGNHRSL